VIRPVGWRTWLHRARSGRRRAVRLPRLALLALCGGLVLLATLTALPAYTPLLHSLAGDPVPNAGWRPLARKAWQENQAALVNLLRARAPRDESPLPTVELFAGREALASLNHDILLYGLGELDGKPRVDGVSLTASGPRAVRLGYRGTNSWHHQAWKPSLRVRYDKGQLEGGFRDHALLAPKDGHGLGNWLSGVLARRWGLITTGRHFVRVFLNRRYLGVYARARRFDESLLIHLGRLPGPFFRLEGTGTVFRRQPVVMEDARAWEVPDLDPHSGYAVIQRMLDAIALPPGSERTRLLDDLFDAEVFARYLAVLCHAGEVHVMVTNLALYLDPGSGRLHPIPIDLAGYNPALPQLVQRPVLLAQNPLFQAWLEDPSHLARFIEQLHALLGGFGSADATVAVVQEAWARMRPDVLADAYVSDNGGRNGTFTRTLLPVTSMDDEVAATCDFVRKRCAFLGRQLATTQVALVERDSEGFEVLVLGLAGATAQRGDEPPQPLLPSLSRLVGRGGHPVAYAFHRLPGAPGDYTFRHRLNGRALPQDPAPGEGLVRKLRDAAGVPPSPPAAPPEPLVLGPGPVVLTHSLDLEPGRALTVAAGTQLLLGPGVSVFVRGPLRVQGTAEAPVSIGPMAPSLPFGAVAVLGPHSAGTRISHLDMAGGSTAQRHNLQLTGMLSIHDCPDLTIEALSLGANAGGDDGLHVVRSRVWLVDSQFRGARSDAVDFDMVQGVVEGCRFLGAGNDGLDLSQARLVVRDCLFAGCGDKGLSVGEGSSVLVSDARFEDDVLGLAAKDRSRVALDRVRFEGCGTGIGSYRKKWRWEAGGRVWLRATVFANSGLADLDTDRHSAVFLVGAAAPPSHVRGQLPIQEAVGMSWPA
jgi:CotH kinase protein/Right handed beta helix region